MDGQALTRADLDTIQKGISTWDARAKALSANSSGRRRNRSVAPTW
jgi:hypothetical protein